MRVSSLAAALALLVAGCGFDGGRTGPEDPELSLPEPDFTLPEPALATTGTTTNVWTPKAPMPTAQAFFGAGVVNGVLYTVGGYNGNDKPTTLVQAYTPGANSWTTRAPCPRAGSI